MARAPDGQNPHTGRYPGRKPNVTRPPRGYYEDGSKRRRLKRRRVPLPYLNRKTGFGRGVA